LIYFKTEEVQKLTFYI